jgi:hAT family C-terminal dimerisation region
LNPKFEIEKYLHLKIDREDKYMLHSDDRIACVQFWIRHKGRFPTLYEAALRILEIPASQYLSERAFSAATNGQPATRDSILPSTLSDIVYLLSKAESSAEEK